MRSPLLALLLCCLLAPFGQAAVPADTVTSLAGDTKIPFSAERSIVTNGKTYDGHVSAAPGMQRHEQVLNGLPLVAILRADRQVAWLMLPGLHIYAEFAFPKAVTEYDGIAALGPPLGSEIVAGLKCRRYRVEHEGTDGSALNGTVWMTGDGIVMKLDGTYSSPKNKLVTASFQLSNVKLGPQDPALFEIPKGMKKLPVEMVQGLLSLQQPKH